MINGELELGQIASAITEIRPAAEVVNTIMAEFEEAKRKVAEL